MTYTYKYPRPAVTADVVAITKEEVPGASDSERLRAIQGMLGIPRWFHGNGRDYRGMCHPLTSRGNGIEVGFNGSSWCLLEG